MVVIKQEAELAARERSFCLRWVIAEQCDVIPNPVITLWFCYSVKQLFLEKQETGFCNSVFIPLS